ncbi:MAG: TRAP transporter fused permease subunit [Firmicutes bacterium]|nr:TRAP transporter fused permease subunit [Bacillota bacterium]
MNTTAEGRSRSSLITTIVSILSIFLAIFHVYTGISGLLYTYTQRGLHLGLILVIFILNSLNKEKGLCEKIVNVLLLLATLTAFAHLFINMDYISYRFWGAPLTPLDIVTGILLFAVVFIVGKRVVGWTLPIIMLLAVLYGFFGNYLSGVFKHGGYGWRTLLELATWSEMGIFSQALGVSATYLYLFILFGTLIDKMGTGSTLMDLAKTIAGKQKGGPAKLAVVSSAMMGTISGSPVSNVLTTGAFTIPLMRKLGFSKAYAGAVEAVASTGGMILPPVMGVLAFAMVDYSGIPYASIAKSALIPALLYYLGAYMSVHFRAHKRDLQSMDVEDLPSAGKVLKNQWYTLLPILILAVPLVMGFTPLLTVSWAILSLIPVSFLNKDRNKWLTPAQLLDAVNMAARNAVSVALPTALAGIIAGVLGVTGVGIRLSSVLIELSGGNLLILLILVAIITIIMGCGLPALLAYIVQIPVTIPALIQMGVPTMAAHLFVVYYATLAFITPPVGGALYAAMAMSNSSLMEIGKEAVKIALPGFLAPFMFVYIPDLLLITEFGISSFLMVLTAILGIIILASSVEGYLFNHLSIPMRLLFAVAALLLIVPNNLIGVATIAVLAILFFFNMKKTNSSLIK